MSNLLTGLGLACLAFGTVGSILLVRLLLYRRHKRIFIRGRQEVSDEDFLRESRRFPYAPLMLAGRAVLADMCAIPVGMIHGDEEPVRLSQELMIRTLDGFDPVQFVLAIQEQTGTHFGSAAENGLPSFSGFPTVRDWLARAANHLYECEERQRHG